MLELEQVLDDSAQLASHGREIAPAQAFHLFGEILEVERRVCAGFGQPAQLGRLLPGPGVVVGLVERSLQHLCHRAPRRNVPEVYPGGAPPAMPCAPPAPAAASKRRRPTSSPRPVRARTKAGRCARPGARRRNVSWRKECPTMRWSMIRAGRCSTGRTP